MEKEKVSSGVVYYNRGSKCICRLIVSLMTLRRHYNGPTTVFLEGEHPEKFVSSLKEEFGVDIIYRPDIQIQTGTLVHKIEISMETPYDLSVWMDSDTVILGEFSELFELAKDCDLVAVHFAGWKTDGGTISKRIRRYEKLCPQYIDAAIKYGPAINTGVYAWKKDSVFFKEWLEVAKWGDDKMFIADEVACQVLLPQYNCKVADPKYNVSVLHDPGTKDPRIVHFHGKKHCKEAPKCSLWIDEFAVACKKNLCGIRNYINEDKRLRRFLDGRYGRKEKAKEIKAMLESKPETKAKPEISRQKDLLEDEVTIVTGCDLKYVEHLRTTLPNWIRLKKIDRYPFIVYTNGFDNPENDERLAFLKVLPKLRIIKWDMPQAQSQRERMLSAFVLGTARDVITPYWMKIDADAYAVNDAPLIDDEMKKFAICGHKWGYSYLNVFEPLVKWANGHEAFSKTPKDSLDPARIDGKRYRHERVASYVQLHQTDFSKMAASLIKGDRMPVPSHDTYMWYVAQRLGLPIKRHNFKRFRGMTNKSDINSLRVKVAEVEKTWKR